MKYIEFDMSKPLDFIPIGRIAIDFNPTDMYRPLSESSNFNKYVGARLQISLWVLRVSAARWALPAVFPPINSAISLLIILKKRE